MQDFRQREACFREFFQNPLADPHILGVSSWCRTWRNDCYSFWCTGECLWDRNYWCVCFYWCDFNNYASIFDWRHEKGAKTIGILLTGTAISTLFSAVMSLLMSLNHDKIEQVYLWTMGSFSAAVWVKVCYVAICEMVCLCVCIVLSKDLNLMAMGEETAQSLGIETARIRRILILVVSVMVAACVSVSGVIGFVGLVIPHIVRFLLGDDYRRILPGAILGGGFFLMICDTLARTVTAPGELPVGVLTAIVGAPYLILLIKRKMA